MIYLYFLPLSNMGSNSLSRITMIKYGERRTAPPMTVFPVATLPEEEILEQLGTSLPDGLSSGEAVARLGQSGFNEITADKVEWWEIALRQFRSAFIYLLLVAALIVLVIGEYIDAAVIIGFVIINAALGFYQEYRSEQSLRALQQYIRPKSR